MADNLISYEEYYNAILAAVKKNYLKGFNLKDEQIEKYVKSQEGTIKEWYDLETKKHMQAGTNWREQFEKYGLVGGEAYSLDMMYE